MNRPVIKPHLYAPEKQVKIDIGIGRDIGYNPYPIYSDYWYEYRRLYFLNTLDTDRKKGV